MKEVVSMLQHTVFLEPSSAGALDDREQQLVSDLLRLYRNGSSYLRIEEKLHELRAVREELHLRETPRRTQ